MSLQSGKGDFPMYRGISFGQPTINQLTINST